MGDKEGEGGVKNLKKIYVIYGRAPKFIHTYFFWPIFELSNLFIDIEKQIDWKGMEKKVLFSYIYVKSVVLNFRVVTKYSREKNSI